MIITIIIIKRRKKFICAENKVMKSQTFGREWSTRIVSEFKVWSLCWSKRKSGRRGPLTNFVKVIRFLNKRNRVEFNVFLVISKWGIFYWDCSSQCEYDSSSEESREGSYVLRQKEFVKFLPRIRWRLSLRHFK